MKSSYKKLGPYIRQVDIRNSEGKEENLLGVSTNKVFMTSIANTVGTDFTKYKVVKRNQFTYVPDTSRRGDKIAIALLDQYAEAIVSSAYTVFEITDHSQLLPEYLMMWFSRPEFDRYARFMSHGSVREIFGWEEMCGVELPVPSIEEQKKIVKEYKTVLNGIKTYQQLNEKLLETAQAIYKHWFVDFEFPDENGQPYKSNGGEMEFNQILDMEVPKGWVLKPLGEVCNCYDYLRKPLSQSDRTEMKGIYPYYGAMSIVDYIDKYLFDGIYLLFSEDGANIVDEKGHPALQYVWGKFWVNNHAHIIKGNDLISTEFLYLSLRNANVSDLVTGAAQPKINQENMNSIPVLVPDDTVLCQFNKLVSKLFQYLRDLSETKLHVSELADILLSKFAARGGSV